MSVAPGVMVWGGRPMYRPTKRLLYCRFVVATQQGSRAWARVTRFRGLPTTGGGDGSAGGGVQGTLRGDETELCGGGTGFATWRQNDHGGGRLRAEGRVRWVCGKRRICWAGEGPRRHHYVGMGRSSAPAGPQEKKGRFYCWHSVACGPGDWYGDIAAENATIYVLLSRT